MKKLFTLVLMSLLTTVGAVAQETWTIAGVTALCGVEWDPTATQNDMTTADGVTYKLVKEGCVLEKGVSNGYKAVKDHSWNTSVPAGMGNQYLKVEETGTYTVTFTLDVTTMVLTAEAVKTGDAVIGEKTWTVAGSPAALFGTEWDQTNTANDMTKRDDGIYSLELKGKALAKGKIEYKICANHAWSESYPESNETLEIPEDGIYDVTFIFNPENKDHGAMAVKTGDVVIEKVYSVVGAFQLLGGDEPVEDDEASTTLFGGKWDVATEANDMSADGSNFVLVKSNIDLPAGQIACKVAVNHSWNENYGAEGVMDGDNVFTPITQAGTYNVKFTFNPETKILTVEPTMTATGIHSIGNGQWTIDNEAGAWYDLSGRKLSNGKLSNGQMTRGVVIMNGKKVATTR